MASPVLTAAAEIYGPQLEQASRRDLAAIVSFVGLELECRHCTGKLPDEFVYAITEGSDTELMTLAIAALWRLKFPLLKPVPELEMIQAA